MSIPTVKIDESVIYLFPLSTGSLFSLFLLNICFSLSRKHYSPTMGGELLEKLISENNALSLSVKEAYKTYISGYDSHSMKGVFNAHRLDLKEVAASFGFSSPPKVALKINRGGDGYRSKREPVNKYNRARGGRAGGKTKFERY